MSFFSAERCMCATHWSRIILTQRLAKIATVLLFCPWLAGQGQAGDAEAPACPGGPLLNGGLVRSQRRGGNWQPAHRLPRPPSPEPQPRATSDTQSESAAMAGAPTLALLLLGQLLVVTVTEAQVSTAAGELCSHRQTEDLGVGWGGGFRAPMFDLEEQRSQGTRGRPHTPHPGPMSKPGAWTAGVAWPQPLG